MRSEVYFKQSRNCFDPHFVILMSKGVKELILATLQFVEFPFEIFIMGFHSGPFHSSKVPLEKVQPGTARAAGELRHDGPWKLENTGKLQKRRLGGEPFQDSKMTCNFGYFGVLVRDDTSHRADGWGLAALGRQR